MAPLDTLYGEGTSTAFREKCDVSAAFPGVTAAVSEFTDKHKAVATDITWTNASKVVVARCHIDFYPRRANYSLLWVTPAQRGKGLYQRLIINQPVWMRTLGVQVLTATPDNPRSEYILALGGFQWQTYSEERWFAALTANSRMTEYREWLLAGEPAGSEPAWHRELREHPVAGEEEY